MYRKGANQCFAATFDNLGKPVFCVYFRPSISATDTAVIPGICWTTDLDYFGHMNNGKYFRDLDFAR